MGIFKNFLGAIYRNTFTFGNQRPRRLAYAVGLYTIGYGIYDMGAAAVCHKGLREAHNLKKRYGKGTWVVITGATNDLGLEYAKRLAD